MTVCPIAVVAGCKKCPAFSICPLKTLLGDQKPQADAPPAEPPSGGQHDRKPPRKH